MTRTRILIALGIVAALAALLAFQRHRQALMTACIERGGVWRGAETTCELKPFGPILKRALERS
jgi:hypothetical protein